jgi:hypothetical protein
MGSIFEKLWRLGPAAFVFKAIIVAIVADGLLLAFIFAGPTANGFSPGATRASSNCASSGTR